MKKILSIAFLSTALLFNSCKKEDESTPVVVVTSQQVITNFSDQIAHAMYKDMVQQATALEISVTTLKATPNISNLVAAQQAWKTLRTSWEYSEAFLFGPIADLDLDPSWDDWPVNHQDFDAILASSNTLDANYVSGLSTSSKGFHALEYILFGQNNNQQASNLTNRQLEYAVALAQNIKSIATQCETAWSNGFLNEIKTAGAGSTRYTTKKAALLEITNAMIGICGETGEEKIKSVFEAQDPRLEESQFSQNSMTDFRANIKGAEKVYLGDHITNGIGLSEWTQQYNKTLDLNIKQAFTDAHNALNGVTDPFGTAITSQPNQIQNAITKIGALETQLEELIPLINQRVTD